jgi:hypothetical protein
MENYNAVEYKYYHKCKMLEEELEVYKRFAELQTYKLEKAREANKRLIATNEALANDNINCRLMAKTPLKYKAKAHAYKVEMRRCQRKLQRIYAESTRIADNMKAAAFSYTWDALSYQHMKTLLTHDLMKFAKEIQKLRNV